MECKNFNDTARSGKTQTLDEVLKQLGYLQPEPQPATQEQLLVALLDCTQRIIVHDFYSFMYETCDWIVALQWMQDHQLFKSNPQRPPFTAFKLWLHAHNVPQHHEQCTTRNLTYVNKKIAGARYPWANVKWEPNVVKRWRVMYQLMDLIWKAFSEHNDVSRNHVSGHE